MDSHTMVYVGERSGTSYSLNRVDINNPTQKISQSIGSNVAVIAADTGGSKIGIIQAVERGYETFAGSYTKIYDAATLALLKTFPLAPPAAEGRIIEPLHHRDPSLSLTDKYAVALTEDDGYFASGGAQQYVSVYDIAGNKEVHLNAFQGAPGATRGAASTVLGVGTLMGAVVHGDYIILGGNTGTAVFRIDASGSALTISKVEGSSDTVGNHWFKDNGVYVLESKSNTGMVKVWKWNASGAAPTEVGTIDVYGVAGSVQALSFDPGNTAKAYFFNKAAASGEYGAVYSVDLSASELPKTTLFSFPRVVIQISGRAGSAYYQCEMSGMWTIEKQSAGADDYYVFSGSYSYTPANGSLTTLGGVFTVKNPPTAVRFK